MGMAPKEKVGALLSESGQRGREAGAEFPDLAHGNPETFRGDSVNLLLNRPAAQKLFFFPRPGLKIKLFSGGHPEATPCAAKMYRAHTRRGDVARQIRTVPL